MPRIVAAVVAIFLAALCADLYAGEIHDAARRGDRASVERLLHADPRLLESTDSYGRTPLVCAAQQRKLAMVQFLLSEGAAPDVECRNRGTLLHEAAEQGNSDLTKLLL